MAERTVWAAAHADRRKVGGVLLSQLWRRSPSRVMRLQQRLRSGAREYLQKPNLRVAGHVCHLGAGLIDAAAAVGEASGPGVFTLGAAHALRVVGWRCAIGVVGVPAAGLTHWILHVALTTAHPYVTEEHALQRDGGRTSGDAEMVCVAVMLLGVGGSRAVHLVPVTTACTAVAAPTVTATRAPARQNPHTTACEGADWSTIPSP